MSLFTFLRRPQHGDPGWFRRNIGEPIEKTKKADVYDQEDVEDAFKLLHVSAVLLCESQCTNPSQTVRPWSNLPSAS